MEATTPELGPVRFWSPKSSSFSGRDSIVLEEAAKKRSKSRPSVTLALANGCNPTTSFAQAFQHANDIHSRHYE